MLTISGSLIILLFTLNGSASSTAIFFAYATLTLIAIHKSKTGKQGTRSHEAFLRVAFLYVVAQGQLE
jgi:hypothetical protein